MFVTRSFLGVLWIALLVASNAQGEGTPEQQACADIASRPADGSASDRFMREWCQRDAGAKSSAADQTTAEPEKVPRPDPPCYRLDDTADQLNSSRLPPGYHCHMLKFGERICHGGMD